MSDRDYLSDYEGRLGSRRFTSISQLTHGDLVQFLYRGEMRLGLVLAPNYKDKLHVISLKEIPLSTYTDMVRNIRPLPASPQELYNRVRSISLDFTAYRQYLLSEVTQLQKVLPKKVITKKLPKWTVPDWKYKEWDEISRAIWEDLNATTEDVLDANKSLITLTESMWRDMQNSTWSYLHVSRGDSISDLESLFAEFDPDTLNPESDSYRDIRRIANGIANGDSIPAPIVLIKEGFPPVLAGGNTRLCVARAMGIYPQVFAIYLPKGK